MRNILQSLLGLLLVIVCSCSDKSTNQRNHPKLEIGDLPPVLSQIPALQTFHHQFKLLNADSSAQYAWQTVAIDNAPVGNFGINQDGTFQFRAEETDYGEIFSFRVLVSTSEQELDFHDFSVTVAGEEPVILQIVQSGAIVSPGSWVDVSIIKVSGNIDFGSLQMCITFDPNVLSPLHPRLGNDVGPFGCAWEYSTYRYISSPQFCEPVCKSLLILNAISDANNGPSHPKCTSVPDGTELFHVTFESANDSTLYCSTSSVDFIWIDCKSNATAHSNQYGDSVVVGSTVMTSDWNGAFPIDHFRVRRSDCDSMYTPSLSGWCDRYLDDCFIGEIADRIIFWNGEIQFDCK